MHWAVIFDNPEAVEILASAGGDVDKATELTEERPLHFAAMLNRQKALPSLLKFVDVMARSSAGWTALHYAAAYGHSRIVEILIDCGADLDAKASSSEITALMLATDYGHGSVTSLLLSFSFSRHCRPAPYITPTVYQYGAEDDPPTSHYAASPIIEAGDEVRIVLQARNPAFPAWGKPSSE